MRRAPGSRANALAAAFGLLVAATGCSDSSPTRVPAAPACIPRSERFHTLAVFDRVARAVATDGRFVVATGHAVGLTPDSLVVFALGGAVGARPAGVVRLGAAASAVRAVAASDGAVALVATAEAALRRIALEPVVRETGAAPLPDAAVALDAGDGLAVAVVAGLGLVTVDAGAPVPRVLGVENAAAGALDVALGASVAWVTFADGRLAGVDVAQPATPALFVEARVPARPVALAAAGDRVWVATAAGVAGFDVGEPSRPRAVAGIAGGRATDVAADGARLWVAWNERRVVLYETGGNGFPVPRAATPAGNAGARVDAAGTFAAVVDAQAGARAIAAAAPVGLDARVLVSSVDPGAGGLVDVVPLGGARVALLDGAYVRVAELDAGGVRVRGEWAGTSSLVAGAADSGVVWVASAGAGIVGVDAREPDSLRVVATRAPVADVRALVADEGVLYLVVPGGLVRDELAPGGTRRFTALAGADTRAVALSSSLAWVATSGGVWTVRRASATVANRFHAGEVCSDVAAWPDSSGVLVAWDVLVGVTGGPEGPGLRRMRFASEFALAPEADDFVSAPAAVRRVARGPGRWALGMDGALDLVSAPFDPAGGIAPERVASAAVEPARVPPPGVFRVLHRPGLGWLVAAGDVGLVAVDDDPCR